MSKAKKLRALSTIQIEKYFQTWNVNALCVPIALLEPVNNGKYIVNLDPNPEGTGTHWTALCVHGSHYIYFDSFGAPPPTAIINSARKNNKFVAWNNFIVQDYNSDACGYYCLLFILLMSKNPSVNSFNEFINSFNDNTQDNESMLNKIF